MKIECLNRKRGLSTIVSTLLLIVLALAIASIVFASYRSIVDKEIVKAEFEEKCFGIEIRAEESLEGVSIINIGNENVEGVALTKEEGEAEHKMFEEVLKPGDSIFINSSKSELAVPIFKNGDSIYICKEKRFIVL